MSTAEITARIRLLFRPDDDRFTLAAHTRAVRALAAAVRATQTQTRRHP